MKPGRAAASLNLPTLLSFNELAWVAVSAMALFCGYQLTQDSANSVDDLRQELAAMSNEVRILRLAHQKASNELERAAARFTDAANRLAAAQRELIELQSRLARAQQDADALSNRLARVEEEASNLKRKLTEAERLHASRGTELAATTQTNLLLQGQLQQATERAQELERRLADVLTRLADRPTEGNIRKELLSLRGVMSNVVILLDRSSSMADGRRWEDSLRVIEAWLEYLPIENCALIAFGTDCQVFPAEGSYFAVGGTNEAARQARTTLLRQVRALRPDGNTATVEALERAYQYPGVDTIILFTDGEPLDLRRVADRRRFGSVVHESELTPGERKRIAKIQIEDALALARRHPHIPINVVALADYFTEWKAEFLLGLARYSGGAFLGR